MMLDGANTRSTSFSDAGNDYDARYIVAVDRGSSITPLIQPFMSMFEDSRVTEIAVNRPGEIWTEALGVWEKHKADYVDMGFMRALAIAVGSYTKGEISATRPILSATLPNNERVQFVMPPACEANTLSMTLRKPSQRFISLENYATQGFFDNVKPVTSSLSETDIELLALKKAGKIREFLTRAVHQNKNIMIAGETGSGKTTFMKALIAEIPRNQRIITIEDVPELFLPYHENHVHLFYPSEVTESDNAPVTAGSLLRSCMRMKPTRILPAEIRGGEAYDFLNACMTGHGGAITSIHAGSCKEALDRLSMLILQNNQGGKIPYEIIREKVRSTIDIVVHMPLVEGRRSISEIWFAAQEKEGADV
jgi:type IV secretion system protein VirB11